MALDRRYLKRHGNQWLVVVKVPERLRKILGKAHLKHPLRTDSLAIANREKYRHVAALKARIEEAERKLGSNPLGNDQIVTEAIDWRRALREAEADPSFYEERNDQGDVVSDGADIVRSVAEDRAEEIERREGRERARAFLAIVAGTATPFVPLIDGWLTWRPMKPRQQTDYRRAVAKLARWLEAERHPPTVEAVTRKLASRYIQTNFVDCGAHPKTANKDISCLSGFWKWMVTQGHAEANIWAGLSLAKREASKADSKRPFTDEEIRKLFEGDASPLLRDFMAIAALSGMRVEEIARLEVGDCTNLTFDIREAKTQAGVRPVPIHPDIQEIVNRRAHGKDGTEPLFPELPRPKPGSPIERSQKVVKAFTSYRRRIGVDDVRPGARQSRVDFHSFRRWFITKAEQAGQPPHFIEAVVGHKRAGMTLGRYSAGPLLSQFRAVVEAVRLPDARTELEEDGN